MFKLFSFEIVESQYIMLSTNLAANLYTKHKSITLLNVEHTDIRHYEDNTNVPSGHE